MRVIFIYVVTALWGMATLVQAQEALQQSKTIVAGLTKPPYVIEESSSGIQLDLIRAAFHDTNFDISFVHIPFGRNITGYQQFNAAGVLTVPPDISFPEMYASQPYIYYQNIAVSLLEKDFSIHNVSDLAGKSITAFQNARKYLGEEYSITSLSFMNYREVPDQNKQIELLFLHRTDVIVLDINIFKSYLKTHADSKFSKPFKVHYIFGERPYSVGFRTTEMRDIFDNNIKKMQANGSYQLIIDKYL